MDVLARQVERFAAGRQHPHPGAAGAQFVDDRRGRGDHVLTVVEHDQHPAVGQMVGDAVQQGPVGPAGEFEGPGERRLDQFGADRGEVDEPHAVGELRTRDVPDLDRESRLADPARTDQGDERVADQIGGEAGDVVGSTDQRRPATGQAAGPGGRGPGSGAARAGAGGQAESGVLVQHAAVQLPQLRAGVDAQFLGQHGRVRP